jgi:hypothetical protein
MSHFFERNNSNDSDYDDNLEDMYDNPFYTDDDCDDNIFLPFVDSKSCWFHRKTKLDAKFQPKEDGVIYRDFSGDIVLFYVEKDCVDYIDSNVYDFPVEFFFPEREGELKEDIQNILKTNSDDQNQIDKSDVEDIFNKLKEVIPTHLLNSLSKKEKVN